MAEDYPQYFREVNLQEVNKQHQWVQFCVYLAEHGFPCHDKFMEVISTLTAWFAFVELPNVDRTKIKDLLRTYTMTKHNRRISRLNDGHVQEVMENVDRIVDDTIAKETVVGEGVFAELRQKRDNGKYRQLICLEEVVGGSSSNSTPSYLVSFLCGSLRDQVKASETSDWEYVADDTPLPDELLEMIHLGFAKANIKLRKNSEGVFPTIMAITRLINYLYRAKSRGQGRVSRILFEKMGFPKSSPSKERLKNMLINAGILEKGGYRSMSASRIYLLTPLTLAILDEARKTPPVP